MLLGKSRNSLLGEIPFVLLEEKEELTCQRCLALNPDSQKEVVFFFFYMSAKYQHFISFSLHILKEVFP